MHWIRNPSFLLELPSQACSTLPSTGHISSFFVAYYSFLIFDVLDAAVYQNSGDVNSQWDHFVGRRWFYDTLPTISNGDTIGKSCDFWNMCDPATLETLYALKDRKQLL